MKNKPRLLAAFAMAAAVMLGGCSDHSAPDTSANDATPPNQPYTTIWIQEDMVEMAREAYLTQYPGDTQFAADSWDPFRHAYITAKVAQFYGDVTARIFGDANEVKPDNNDEKRMDFYNNEHAIALWGDDPSTDNFGDLDLTLAANIREAIADGTLKSHLSDVPPGYHHTSLFLNADEVLTYAKHNPVEAALLGASGVGILAGSGVVLHKHKKKKKEKTPEPA